MRELIILVGIPASSKSTFAARFLGSGLDTVVLSSDSYRGVIGGSEDNQRVSAEVFQVLEWNTEYFLKQGIFDVLIDSCAVKPARRNNFIKIGRKYGAKIVCYYFNVSLEKCLERNSKRGRVVPPHIIEKFSNELVVPTTKEFDEINVINEDGHAVGGIVSGNSDSYGEEVVDSLNQISPSYALNKENLETKRLVPKHGFKYTKEEILEIGNRHQDIVFNQDGFITSFSAGH